MMLSEKERGKAKGKGASNVMVLDILSEIALPTRHVAPIAGDATAIITFREIVPRQREREKGTKEREKDGKREETGTRDGSTRARARAKAGKGKVSFRNSIIIIIVGLLCPTHNPIPPRDPPTDLP